jgi:hypothetical protein
MTPLPNLLPNPRAFPPKIRHPFPKQLTPWKDQNRLANDEKEKSYCPFSDEGKELHLGGEGSLTTPSLTSRSVTEGASVVGRGLRNPSEGSPSHEPHNSSKGAQQLIPS